mmetsp:Transcript_62102/g.147147  ORF Transcript_62102/g.147147 Transcript_62102/m.147147 type:complete len:146 (+) Transcript_62102:457-894(+)
MVSGGVTWAVVSEKVEGLGDWEFNSAGTPSATWPLTPPNTSPQTMSVVVRGVCAGPTPLLLVARLCVGRTGVEWKVSLECTEEDLELAAERASSQAIVSEGSVLCGSDEQITLRVWPSTQPDELVLTSATLYLVAQERHWEHVDL